MAVRKANDHTHGFHLLGPYRITWSDPDINNRIDLVDLEEGNLVYDCWVEVIQPFNGQSATDGLGVSIVGTPVNLAYVFVSTDGGGRAGPPMYVPGLSTYVENAPRPSRLTADGTVYAWVDGSPSQGAADIWLLMLETS